MEKETSECVVKACMNRENLLETAIRLILSFDFSSSTKTKVLTKVLTKTTQTP